MYINDYYTDAKHFAFDGCHKIYLLNNKEQYEDAREAGYNIFDIKELPEVWKNSCHMRFINTWDLQTIVPQFAKMVVFK